jgi:DNA-binding MarR family transcriptional regulator
LAEYHYGVVSTQRNEPTSTSPDADETVALLELLTDVTSKVHAAASRVVAEFDLSPTAAALLWNLKPGTEPPTMRALAGRLYCDPSTISLTADRLQAAGLVQRRPHPTDGRKRTLALTDAGQELWTTLSGRLHAASALAALDSEERATLARLLTKAKMG